MHAAFGVACYLLLNQQKPESKPRQLTWIELEPASARKRAEARAAQDTLQKKVVQSDAGREAAKAAPNAFLGEKTRIVDRQTVNQKKLTVMGQKGAARPSARAAPAEKPAARPAEKKLADAKPAPALSKLGLAILPEARRPNAMKELAKDEPQWANIGSQPQDYVDGIKQSDRTALNTREYSFFGYHQRIRQRLELQWTRMLRETLTKFYKGGRQLASDTEYVTRVLVVLNARGEITKVKVVGMSGTQELDQVAVEAFNRAGPFPNPPKGLVQNGEIEVPWELRLRS